MRPASLYLLLWTLGCAVGFVAALLVLHRRHVLTPATALTVALAWLFLFVGSKWHSRLEYLPWTSALLVSPAELFAPGRRLPLGLLTSGVAAALSCLLLRLPWRAVGDALAVFWSVLIPIGRIGCMVYGCCLGGVCGAWLRPLGWRYGPGSEAFRVQVAAGLIEPTSGESLPVHPLPVYFALASIATLVVLLRLLRHGAPPGTLLLVFGLLRPATKLALEPLRAEPAPSWLMIGIPAATLTIATTIAAFLLLRRAGVVGRRRLATRVLLPFLLVALAPSVAAADDRSWAASLARYAQNPLRNRRVLRRLEREGPGDHPPVVLLALADARLRSGRFAAAGTLFDRVIAIADEPLASWALRGRSWARLLAGEESSFARVVDDARASATLHGAARLADAYARYWARDDAGAIEAFDAAVEGADGDLVDDARYGAARARIRAGDVGGALSILHDLAAWHVNGSAGEPSAALVALDRQALLRAGFERYRRGALRPPEQHLRLVLDGDGVVLARAALRELGEPVEEPGARPIATVAAAPAATRVISRPATASARSEASLEIVAAWSRRLLLVAAVIAALLIAQTRWRDRWTPPGGNHGPRTD